MTEPARHTRPFYDVGSCPICGDGLRGVRICCRESVILCDECDAVWSSPDLADRISATAEPPCRQCGQSLWGNQARWATRAEVEAAGWWPDVRRGEHGLSDSAGTEVDQPPAFRSMPSNAANGPGAVYGGAIFILLLVGAAVAALAVL